MVPLLVNASYSLSLPLSFCFYKILLLCFKLVYVLQLSNNAFSMLLYQLLSDTRMRTGTFRSGRDWESLEYPASRNGRLMHVDLAVSQHPVPLVTGHHQLHPLPTRSYMLFAGFVWASLPGQSPGIINGLNFRNVGCLVLLLCIRQADLWVYIQRFIFAL